jgi:4-diphosphocytidyl-2C-methyl-D-erythritol kinase
LGRSLQAYAVAQDKIGAARLAQDSAITNNFYKPWTSTLNNQINAAVKARQHVKSARLSLDAARAKYKHLSGSGTGTASSAAVSNAQKIEQARLEVEAAEEILVTATEEAINLMRAVLDNVRTASIDKCWKCTEIY